MEEHDRSTEPPVRPDPGPAPADRPSGRLGPLGVVVVAIAAVIGALRIAAGAAGEAESFGAGIGYVLGAAMVGAIVWAVIVQLTRGRTPGRRFRSPGLAISIAVALILATIGSAART